MTERTQDAWSIQAVVFDLDGTLIDTEPIFHEAARRLLARHGKELDITVMRSMMGTPAREALPLFRAGHGLTETVEQLAVAYREHFTAAAGGEPMRLLPGVLDLFALLERQRIPKAIGTSSTLPYVKRVLTPHGLLERFNFILTADDVTHGKPHPEMFLKAADRFGVPPANVLVIEDSVNGMKAAKAAGAKCIVVPHDLVPREELHLADAVVPRIDAPAVLAVFGG